MKYLSLLVILIATGCQSVPATKINFNPTSGNLTLESPKEIGFSNLVATLPNGTGITLTGYQSHNSADVIAAVASANAQMAQKYIEALQILQDLAKQGAMKGSTGGLAP